MFLFYTRTSKSNINLFWAMHLPKMQLRLMKKEFILNPAFSIASKMEIPWLKNRMKNAEEGFLLYVEGD